MECRIAQRLHTPDSWPTSLAIAFHSVFQNELKTDMLHLEDAIQCKSMFCSLRVPVGTRRPSAFSPGVPDAKKKALGLSLSPDPRKVVEVSLSPKRLPSESNAPGQSRVQMFVRFWRKRRTGRRRRRRQRRNPSFQWRKQKRQTCWWRVARSWAKHRMHRTGCVQQPAFIHVARMQRYLIGDRAWISSIRPFWVALGVAGSRSLACFSHVVMYPSVGGLDLDLSPWFLRKVNGKPLLNRQTTDSAPSRTRGFVESRSRPLRRRTRLKPHRGPSIRCKMEYPK